MSRNMKSEIFIIIQTCITLIIQGMCPQGEGSSINIVIVEFRYFVMFTDFICKIRPGNHLLLNPLFIAIV